MLDFLGIGAQKAGTTWLYSQLAKHPRIRFPKGKEVHYWDWVQAGRRPDDISWYRQVFADPGGFIQGDITPDYAILEERYIRQIHALNPDLRIFFILRNPIERAWSAAQMGLAKLQMTREEASDPWFFDVFRSQASLARGDYEATLRRWGGLFGSEQLLLLYYQDLQENPRKLLVDAALHLGVDASFFDTVPEGELRRRVHPGMGFHLQARPPLTESLAAELRRLYSDKITSLSRYLKKDLSGWLNVPIG
ncbi:sulfotransferase domain-containing protein [Nitrosococcus wardiae]|uniref:Sulfotransferase n=1 Tax=Nitrosococcus wardiae TaxID=1814290 RepID=A0A4P7BUE5_9GAMM|nr:sulfotransferase domain-containing protein [Nitrosococcus wardiae]QBQ53553.1 sulfotransferase [Nitrosococcus wardiae]